MKEQIQIRTIGCQWPECHQVWTKLGVSFSEDDELCGHLLQKILPYEDNHIAPQSATITPISNVGTAVSLGTETIGSTNLKAANFNQKEHVTIAAKEYNWDRSNLLKEIQPSCALPIDDWTVGLHLYIMCKEKDKENKSCKIKRKCEVIAYDIKTTEAVMVK